jgi:hypothetical protein
MPTIRGLPLTSLLKLAYPRRRPRERPLHVLICVADHYEPLRGGASAALAGERVHQWTTAYPPLAQRHTDCMGRPPQHTFFYPAEEYRPELIEPLAELCRMGLGDVEVHLHHDRDTADGLRQKLLEFTEALHHRHGLLQREADGRISYGFIHGNWALDNSRPDGRWCGVNDELSVLLETGCYADFTMPSAPAACQTRTINSIYYAADDPRSPKSHDLGVAARAGTRPPEESLLMIQGPLALDWSRKKYGFLPAIENGELTEIRPPTMGRLWQWIAAGIHVAGRPDWRFVKQHTHGAWEPNAAMLLGEPMAAFHARLRAFAEEHDWFRYYYVTAREMAQLVHALEANATIDSPDALLQEITSRPKTIATPELAAFSKA